MLCTIVNAVTSDCTIVGALVNDFFFLLMWTYIRQTGDEWSWLADNYLLTEMLTITVISNTVLFIRHTANITSIVSASSKKWLLFGNRYNHSFNADSEKGCAHYLIEEIKANHIFIDIHICTIHQHEREEETLPLTTINRSFNADPLI